MRLRAIMLSILLIGIYGDYIVRPLYEKQLNNEKHKVNVDNTLLKKMFLGYDTSSEREMIKNFEKLQNGRISTIGSKKGGRGFKR